MIRVASGWVWLWAAGAASSVFAAQEWHESQRSSSLASAAPTPFCSVATSASFTNATSASIVDFTTTSSTITVSGVGAYLWDLDVHTWIQHTFCSDLEIALVSPGGTTLDLAVDLGLGYADVFNGTLWDDNALNSGANDHPYAHMVTATPLNPEHALDALRGEDPNGVWTLIVYDDAAGDFGSLDQWTLDVTAFNSPPGNSVTNVYPRNPNLLISFAGTYLVFDNLIVSGLAGSVCSVKVVTRITHTACGDLDISLRSPAGTEVWLSTDNGDLNDDCFDGTTWDEGVLDQAATHAYFDGVVATPLAPEAGLASFVGQNPNGQWRLIVRDDADQNGGTLRGWDLILETCGGCAPPSNYCIAGTSFNGCVPDIGASGTASISAPNGFTLTGSNMDGQRNGGMFYGLGAAQTQIGGGSSYLCTTAPRKRLFNPLGATGGTSGACDGALAIDLNQFMANNPTALGQPFFVGQELYAQAWCRDPAGSSKKLVLSDGLKITLGP